MGLGFFLVSTAAPQVELVHDLFLCDQNAGPKKAWPKTLRDDFIPLRIHPGVFTNYLGCRDYYEIPIHNQHQKPYDG